MSDEHWGARSTPEIVLANRTMALCYATTSVTTAWVLPLFHPAFDKEPELRNRLFCLLVCGYLDSCWEYRSRIEGLKKEATKIGSLSCLYYLDLFSRYIALLVDVLEIFSRDEMILISGLRDQWLHGSWTEMQKENRTIYYAEKGSIIRKKISAAEYNKVFFVMLQPGVDAALIPLRKRFSEFPTFFWAIDRTLESPVAKELMLKDVLLHSNFKSPNVVLKFPPPDQKPPPGTNEACASLLEFGPRVLASDPRDKR